ncbi:DUF1045 domain-containing protein [Roseibium sp.]|uniref:DUF1045 domain-containing protein n=1 Tax=Roseibium sp. TaxID=1936156 RepID=UPI003A978EA5
MRYAIYFAAPADDALMRAGNAWLGRDPYTGASLPQPHAGGLSADRFADLTIDPRRYGFHGTLKAPFELKAGTSEEDLVEACRALSRCIAPFEFAGLQPRALGKFLALVPVDEAPELAAFAEVCMRHFEPLRAPLAASDLERRRKSGLTLTQDRNLKDWGYPYIFDDFRFHMTLSNKLDHDAEAALLQKAAGQHFSGLTGTRRSVGHFGLYTESERGALFKVHTIFPLSGSLTPIAALRTTEVST